MPMRAVLPTISMTWTTMSSPSMIFSPGRRVMMSMAVPPWIRSRGLPGLGGLLGRLLREQLGPQRSRAERVDDLVAAAVDDEDRGAQVRGELAELAARPHGDPHGDALGVLDADARGLLVGELDLVVGEEAPRVGDGEREPGVLHGLQPVEGRLGVGGDQRVATTTEPDQAGRELDDGVSGDLERAEARAVDRDGGHDYPWGSDRIG